MVAVAQMTIAENAGEGEESNGKYKYKKIYYKNILIVFIFI